MFRYVVPKMGVLQFHGMDNAKEIWEAIRTRFGGNTNSKKMQKAVLKQQFESFTISSSEGLEKGYDRFQQLLSQLEAHGAEVSTEDANHKVFEKELTSTSKSSASAQNVAFVSHSKSSTNKVKSGHTGAYSTYTPSTSSNNILEREVPVGFADEVIYSLFVKQSEDLDLLHEDLEQIDDLDIEEMDINWQIAMIAIRMKKFYKKTRRRVRIDGNKPVGFDKKKLELFYREEDFVDKPFYSRFSKTDNFKGVPHPLTRDYTPQPQQEIDDSLYVYGKKGPQKPETKFSDNKFSENSVTSNERSRSASKKPKEAEPSCVTHVKTPRQPMKNQGTPKVNEKNWNEMMERKLEEGYSFIKKKCFICDSLSHLIRDYDFYEKKMAREAELKKQRVFNTGNGVAKPVWNNANRVNHANHFVPRPVQLIVVRQNVNSVRPNVNTGRANVNSVRQNVNSVRSNVNTGSFNINTVKAKQPINTSNSNSFSPVRPQIIHLITWMTKEFDSGCSGYMTGNKDHLDDFEECKGGSVTFGGSKGYITGKGRIRVGNLDFDSVSFVKELGHFNLFSISQICDKQHKVPRQHNMYSFDMKTPALTKDYACLIAKATSDESKLWHRRVRVTKPQNKTPYELLFGPKLIISYIRPFGCHVTILDTLSMLGKFDGKCDEGFLVGYSLNSKAFRVYNLVTKKVEVNLHVKFLEEKPNVKGVGYRWMFDIDYLTDSMNYIPVSLENQTNPHAGTSEVTNSAGTLQTPNANASEEEDEAEELIVVPTAVRHTASKVGPRKSSTNSKAEEFLTELQNLKTQEKEAYSTGISEDTPEILAFRRELDELAPKHLRDN
ncbi:hypothetical protein Tco_0635374 [Tanacetum coccineum]